MRISSPPINSPCFYGIDTPTKKELIGSTHSIEEIRKYITADSLAYLSLEGLLAAAPGDSDRYCNACFTENYPIPFTKAEEMQLGLFDRPSLGEPGGSAAGSSSSSPWPSFLCCTPGSSRRTRPSVRA